MTNTTDTAVERGSGNIVRERGITGTEAARLLGLSRRDVSRLLCGDFGGHSLGCDVDTVVRPPRSAAGGKLRIAGAERA